MSVSTFGAVILASFLACFVTTLGIYIITKYERWGNQNAVYFSCADASSALTFSRIACRWNRWRRHMDEVKKLRLLLPHWIQHSGEHAQEFREYAGRVDEIQDERKMCCGCGAWTRSTAPPCWISSRLDPQRAAVWR